MLDYERPQATVAEVWYFGTVMEIINDNDVKVFIPGIDDELKKETIPNSKPLLPTLFHCVPNVGENVKVFFKCPWDFQTERYYVGPIIEYHDLFKVEDIALINRTRAGLCIRENNNINITCDFEKENTPNILMKSIEEQIELLSKEIFLESYRSKLSQGEKYSIIYGERLMEFLLFIIQVLKTHSHGPNSPAIPDFHTSIDTWTRKIREGYLLNDKVKTR